VFYVHTAQHSSNIPARLYAHLCASYHKFTVYKLYFMKAELV